MKKHGLLGVGNAMVDILTHSDDAFLNKHGLKKGQMQLADAEATDALYRQLGPTTESSGGSIANTVACYTSFGGKGAYIGKIADDQFGKVFRHDMQSIGVAFNTAALKGKTPTARSLVMVTPDAQRTMYTYLGACAELGPDDIDEDLIKQSEIVMLEGYLFDRPQAKAAFRKAAQLAEKHGTKIALSLSDVSCVNNHRDDFMELVDNHVNILFANEKEICALYKTEDFNTALASVRGHCDIAVLTLGSKGAAVVTKNETHMVPVAPIHNVEDTTGAGDSFAAGFLYGYTHGKSLPECGFYGAVAAAEIIQQMGPRPQKRPLSKLVPKLN